MSMEVTSTYGTYAADAYDSAMKKSTEVKSDNVANSVDAYYEKLCKKFPQINIYIMNADKISSISDIKLGNENKIVLNLSKNCLKKMATDEAFAEKIENNISGLPDAHKWLYAKARSEGKIVSNPAAIINADGSTQSTCKLTRANGTNKSTSILSTKNLTKDKLEKMRKENLERRKEEAERIEEAREERKEKKDYMEKLLDSYGEAVNIYDAMGYERESVTSAIDRQA